MPVIKKTLTYPSIFVAASNASSRDKSRADKVCSGTADDATITAAIALLTVGGKVVLSEGTFNINSNIVFLSNVTLEGQGTGTILKIVAGSTANAIEVSSVTDVTIQNLQTDGNKANVNTGGTLYTTVNGIRIYNSSRVNVINCTCHDAYFAGIAVDTSTDIKILNNTCFNSRDNQIFLRPSNTRVIIQGNTTYGSSYSGIQCLRSDYVDVIGNISYSNGPTGAEGDGIGFEGCRYSKIADNIIHSNGIQGIKVDYTVEGGAAQRSSNIAISNNTIYNQVDTGNGSAIEVLRSDFVLIDSNYITGNYRGLNIGETTDVLILNNVILSSAQQAIRCYDNTAARIKVQGNFCENNTGHTMELFVSRTVVQGNTVASGGNEGIRLSGGTNYYITNNTIYDNTNNGIFVGNGVSGVEVRNNTFYNTGSAQDRALYEEAGGGVTTMVGNKIISMATAPYTFTNGSSVYIDDSSFVLKAGDTMTGNLTLPTLVSGDLAINGQGQAFGQPITMNGITPYMFMYHDTTYNIFRIGAQNTASGITSIAFELPFNNNYQDVMAISGNFLGPSATFTNLMDLGVSGQKWKSIYIGTGASTIEGALTLSKTSGNTFIVDTDTLVVDATNNRVGIGTTSPAVTLTVAGGSTDVLRLATTNGSNWNDISTLAGQGIRMFGGTSYATGPALQLWPTGSAFQGMYFDAGSATGADIFFRKTSGAGGNALIISQGTGLATFYENVTLSKTISFASEINNGNSGTSKTVDWTAGNNQKVTLTGNCTFTFTAPAGVGHFSLRLIGDGTVRTLTWPATVKWGVSGAPVVTGTSAHWDIVSFYFDGTNYSASIIQDFS